MAERKPSYWEQLRDPRWQRKRLEIMERDEWTCRDCGRKDQTLNVHHGYYQKGMSPWEYPDWSLMTLCEPCHEKRTEAAFLIQRAIASLPTKTHVNAAFWMVHGMYDSIWNKEVAEWILHADCQPLHNFLYMAGRAAIKASLKQPEYQI